MRLSRGLLSPLLFSGLSNSISTACAEQACRSSGCLFSFELFPRRHRLEPANPTLQLDTRWTPTPIIATTTPALLTALQHLRDRGTAFRLFDTRAQ